MSWAQYCLTHAGYWQKKNREWEEDWRRTREVYWVLFNSNSTKDNQQTRHELIPLPSDSAVTIQKGKKPTKQQLDKATLDFFDVMAAFDVSSN